MKLPDIGEMASLGVLFTLLPGLITYLVVRAMTERAKKIEAVEAVLYALAYTLIVHAIWYGLTGIGSLIPTPDIIGLSLTALFVGIGLAAIVNSGVHYRLLRFVGITSESSWITIWQTVFREFRDRQGEYAVLHLKDGRRVMGAIRGFSPQQKGGHVCLERVQWLTEATPNSEHPGMHLFNAEDIAIVEFLSTSKEPDHVRGQANTTTASAAATPK